MTGLRLVLPEGDRLGESALWRRARHCLSWIDLTLPRLHRFDPMTEAHEVWPLDLPAPPGAIVADADCLVINHARGLSLVNPDTQTLESLCGAELGRNAISCNDCKADRFGRL